MPACLSPAPACFSDPVHTALHHPPTSTGTGFSSLTAADLNITIGNTTCTSITLVSATTITCTTTKPGYRPQGPLPTLLAIKAIGLALSNTSYEYMDLWSRRTTWGGAAPPGEGDSAVVPPGAVVLLDVSPPQLHTLVVEGTLRFDEDAAEELHLQVGAWVVTTLRLCLLWIDWPV
jgi:hypothetical protein